MIQKLVCSLDIARKLKAAGWMKPTAFVWANWIDGQWTIIHAADVDAENNKFGILPAPTLEEFIWELPVLVWTYCNDQTGGMDCKICGEQRCAVAYQLTLERYGDSLHIRYEEYDDEENALVEDGETLFSKSTLDKEPRADAAAKAWLECKENGYDKSEPEEMNTDKSLEECPNKPREQKDELIKAVPEMAVQLRAALNWIQRTEEDFNLESDGTANDIAALLKRIGEY